MNSRNGQRLQTVIITLRDTPTGNFTATVKTKPAKSKPGIAYKVAQEMCKFMVANFRKKKLVVTFDEAKDVRPSILIR